MSLTVILVAAAALFVLIALLMLQRRRAAAAPPDEAASATDTPGPAPGEDARSRHGLPLDQWRPLGRGDRLKAVMRGRRHCIQLLRDRRVALYRALDSDAIRVVHEHDGVYGDRPNWAHIADLTRAMGKAERCWPGADLAGVLSYIDSAVLVEYSPRLVADLEDETAPDPDASTAA